MFITSQEPMANLNSKWNLLMYLSELLDTFRAENPGIYFRKTRELFHCSSLCHGYVMIGLMHEFYVVSIVNFNEAQRAVVYTTLSMTVKTTEI